MYSSRTSRWFSSSICHKSAHDHQQWRDDTHLGLLLLRSICLGKCFHQPMLVCLVYGDLHIARRSNSRSDVLRQVPPSTSGKLDSMTRVGATLESVLVPWTVPGGISEAQLATTWRIENLKPHATKGNPSLLVFTVTRKIRHEESITLIGVSMTSTTEHHCRVQ